ncbi:MAG TPA: helix-turn-helix domain-containing protein, partial [Candidatus Limnocylindrales bacterium]|nr:helix-turn-helix domain-containing protein [Candidatus Limnocylindrales bacterium]
MTAGDDARRGRVDARAARDADRGYAADAPRLPQRLLEARERKGVDLYRAERDTKIRAKYLGALETGDYAELPGAVYTKGFLRNYALYLGLDPEDVIRQWKHERGDTVVPAEPVLAVPRPLEAPRQGLTFSPIVVVAALLTIFIGVFAVYIGIQLVRFAKPPTIAVTTPATAVIDVGEDATEYTLKGTSAAKATITITEAGREQPQRVSADASGRWTADVPLRRGRNEFTISALDPETGKQSETTAKVFITVPFIVIEAPTLAVDSP